MELNCVRHFNTDVSSIALPQKFTFPFYYTPHTLAKIAAEELQEYLVKQQDFEHNFGLQPHQNGLIIGKMFGVLVVELPNKSIAYLAAFSGKLAESNYISFFVPPVFDTLQKNGFYKKGEELLNQYNKEIEAFENNVDYIKEKSLLAEIKQKATTDLSYLKEKNKSNKLLRDTMREKALESHNEDVEQLLYQLNEASKNDSILLKKATKYWNYCIENQEKIVRIFDEQLATLKEKRKQKSASLQQQLFENYSFLNQYQESKSLGEIFQQNPPAGAGECAAPKLLHYAFTHQLKPIALAEFWWGQSPKSEIKKHRQYYPACIGKCKPILSHMLQGIETDKNMLAINPAKGKELKIIYEDEYLAVICKPEEFLSVPGKEITDSVQTRVQQMFPKTTGPLVVHRLDMSTSGLMLIAKTIDIYTALQSQFIQRKIKKTYIALLDGVISTPKGRIDLPLRVDLDNRPYQMVCYEYGKPATTDYEVIATQNGKTLIHFYPITGRTHQLRVHASHHLGLHTPIVGDDLYGTKNKRLCLHASQLVFTHPITHELLTIENPIDFNSFYE